MTAAQMLSTQLLDAAMLNYLRCKFPQLSADELAVQIEETLRFLFIADECTGSIPVSREIDEIWHAWILQTQEYMALCERLPTGRYIHHSSNQYLRYFDATVGEGEDLSESVKMLALYVANFGPFEPQRAPHWLLVRHMTSQWHWPLEAVNDWLCTTPAEPTSICQSVLAKAAPAGQDRATTPSSSPQASASPLAMRPAHELAHLLRQRQISAVELLRLYLERVDRFNPQLNAVVVRLDEAALARAHAADAALARGELWGPLHGLPMTVKESFDVVGTPTTWGFEAQRQHRATEHADAVKRLEDAGAVVFGKTNVPTALADWQTFNPVYGTTCNPWDMSRVPGGSSGGSAAALAAGLCALELGSDIGASIRNPAHYCGVYGHKPTWGVVAMQGQQLPGTECIDALDIAVVGPMARSAHDLSLAMDVLAHPVRSFGPHGWQPATWRDAGTPANRMRVAMLLDDPCAEVDASVQQTLADLARFLRSHGVQVDEGVRPVDSQEAYQTYIGLLRSATGAMMDTAQHRLATQQAQALTEDDRSYGAWIARAQTLSHHGWVQLDQMRRKLQRQWAQFFERYDLLICPTATTPAFEHNQTGQRWERMLQVNGRPQPSTDQLFWAGYPGVVGLPATAVPLATHSAPGQPALPIGAQLIGPAFGDPVCLRFARWLETEYRAFVAPPGFE